VREQADRQQHDRGDCRRRERCGVRPEVSEIELSFNRLQVLADGLTIVAYTAEPGSASAEKLGLLASWAATPTATRADALSRETGDR
jgi:hypothetical protein